MEPKPTLSLEGAVLVSTFYKDYRKNVFVYLIHNLRNEAYAEDVTSTVFMKVAQKIAENEYEDNNNPKSWIMMIAHNAMIDHVRKTKKNPRANPEAVDHLQDHGLNPEEKLEKFELHKDIRSLIDMLPKDQKEIVILRLRDLPFREICLIQGVSINTALGRMRYALINLRRLIKEQGIDLDGYLKPD